MNILGAVKDSETAAAVAPFAINIAAGTADVPGDGNAKLALTRTQDIGAFVAGSVELKTWEEETGIVGKSLTYRERIEKIEAVAERKISVKYVD